MMNECALKIIKNYLKVVIFITQKKPRLIQIQNKSLKVISSLMYTGMKGTLYLKSIAGDFTKKKKTSLCIKIRTLYSYNFYKYLKMSLVERSGLCWFATNVF